jgi:hypothetical protein
MNYISQLNGFRRRRGQHALPPFAQLLWYTLTIEQNKQLWPERLTISSSDLRRIMGGIGVNTLRHARNELVKTGLIETVVAKRGGEVTQYRMIQLFEEKTEQIADPSVDPIADRSADRSESTQKLILRRSTLLLKPINLKTQNKNLKLGRCKQDGGSNSGGLANPAGQAAPIRQQVAGSSRTGTNWQAEPLYGL